jgi:hypothetical protein
MKTFIVYDLDSQMPVAVGEQVSPETARYCASTVTGILHANLLAEEIVLEKRFRYDLHAREKHQRKLIVSSIIQRRLIPEP